jgi:hypothetical protein
MSNMLADVDAPPQMTLAGVEVTPDADPASGLAALAAMAPGPELAALLADVAADGIDDEFELMEVIAGWDRLISWAHAGQLAAIAELARRPWTRRLDPDAARAKRGPLGSVRREYAHDEIAARLSISPGAAGFRLALAVDLAHPLTATGAALAAGSIDVTKARVIADGCGGLDPGTAVEVETRVLGRAADQTSAQVKRAVRRAVITADPVLAQRRANTATTERGTWLTPLEDGLAELRAVLPAADALTIHRVLGAAARAAKTIPGETRTMAQLRADLLSAPFHGAVETGELAGLVPQPLAAHRGTRPGRGEVLLTVPASVIMGISNGPGELAGYGPITADLARQLAADTTWRRVITNPVDGTVLSVDTTTYRPGAVLTRHIETRDQTCRFRGCRQPAVRCHLDHTNRHPIGRTCHHNLGPLCEHHHQFKHALDDALAHLRQPHPGTFTWTMPTGHTYTVKPPALAPPITEQTTSHAQQTAPHTQQTAGDLSDCPF